MRFCNLDSFDIRLTLCTSLKACWVQQTEKGHPSKGGGSQYLTYYFVYVLSLFSPFPFFLSCSSWGQCLPLCCADRTWQFNRRKMTFGGCVKQASLKKSVCVYIYFFPVLLSNVPFALVAGGPGRGHHVYPSNLLFFCFLFHFNFRLTAVTMVLCMLMSEQVLNFFKCTCRIERLGGERAINAGELIYMWRSKRHKMNRRLM